MKRLIDLRMRDRFRFAPEEAEKLGLKNDEKDTIFVVVMKYSLDRISIGNTRTGTGSIYTMEKQEFSGDFLIIPEPGNRTDKVMTEEEAEEAIKYIRKGENRE